MSAQGYDDVQRLVLQTPRSPVVWHRVLRFESPSAGRLLIALLLPEISWRTPPHSAAAVEVALGLSFRGLEALALPEPYLHVFRRLAPAYAQGAPARAAAQLGDTGASAPRWWDEAFALDDAHAVVTVHGSDEAVASWAEGLAAWLAASAPQSDEQQRPRPGVLPVGAPLRGERLPPPPDMPPATATDLPQHWVHFGYRDGLTHPSIRGHGKDAARPDLHEPGELLLGEPRDLGDNPWGLFGRPERLRRLFRHGSFGVLRRIEQYEARFRKEVSRWAGVVAPREAGGPPASAFEDYVRAKLCGRWPNGQVLQPEHAPGPAPRTPPETDFDYARDPQGYGCPFGAHIRRMNPRGASGVHARPRPLFRRGLPYGERYNPAIESEDEPVERGLLGLFFCSDLQDQFEHLLGEWADRHPLGPPGDRRAKDPLIGAHDDPDARFTLPRPRADDPAQPAPDLLQLWGFQPFVRTRGTLYAFYPARGALEQLLKEDWAEEEEGPWPTR